MKVLALDPATSRELRWRAKQAAWVAEAEAEKARVAEQHPTLTLNFRLRDFAHGRLVCFVLAVVLGGIVTFTLTDYNSETDKIFRFYGTFNPCIFFDHYPANLVGLFIVGLTVVSGFGYNVVLFLRLQSIGNLWVTCHLGMVIAIACCLELCFVNVFVANLYHMHDDGQDSNVTSVVDAKNFTREEIEAVADHTNWFSIWLLSQLVMAAVHVRVMCLLGCQRFSLRYSLLFFTMFSMVVGIGQMTVALMASGAGDEAWPDHAATMEGSTAVQKAIMSFRTATNSGIWFWMPAFVFQYTLPKDAGVKLVISLKDTAMNYDELRLIHPPRVIGACFRVLALLAIGTYFFVDVNAESTTAIKMAAGFRVVPFSYFFAPVWVFLVAQVALGVVLTLVQRALMGRQAESVACVGVTWVLLMYSCLWIVIPQFDHSSYVLAPMVLSAAMWVAVAYRGHDQPKKSTYLQLSYALAIIISALIATLHAAGGVLLLLTFLAYEFMVPQLPGVLVEVEVLPINVKEDREEIIEEEAEP
jgi:hypothetical protein